MATVKAINSKASVGRAIVYVLQEKKRINETGMPDEKLVSGILCAPYNARAQMEITKRIWGKQTAGLTNITPRVSRPVRRHRSWLMRSECSWQEK